MTDNNSKLRAPFAYFGSKRSVSNEVWKRFGTVENYVEPFVGSMAILLSNPNLPKLETVNDLDIFLCNFWRAVKHDYKKVIEHADFPVSETHLHSIHKFMVSSNEYMENFKYNIDNDPDFFDVKLAGWWVYGISASIPGNWLRNKGLNALPYLSCAGSGIKGSTANLEQWFENLYERTKKIRVACGDWKRIVSPSVTFNNKVVKTNGTTAVFLDPPYEQKGRYKVYTNETNVHEDVCRWAVENQNVPRLKIAVCGYEGSFEFKDFKFDDTWTKFTWKAGGGMANHRGDPNSNGKINKNKEVIYFNKNCLDIDPSINENVK